MKNLIVIGSGGHAVSCIDVIESTKKFKIIGLICDNKKIGDTLLGYKIIGRLNELKKLKKKSRNIFIAIGQIKTPKLRINVFNKCKKLNFNLPVIISSKAIVSKHSKIGDGTIVHHLAILNANTSIGKNCIINSQSLIEHDVTIEDNCHVSTNAIINGSCLIKKNTFIGSSTVISNNISIKKKKFIKLGSIVKKSI